MPRTARSVEPGGVYHVLNRGNGRMRLFHKPADFDAFELVLAQALERFPDVELLTYCLMSNEPLAEPQRAAITTSVRRGRPYGDDDWVVRTAARLGLQFTLRDHGRPRKPAPPSAPRRTGAKGSE